MSKAVKLEVKELARILVLIGGGILLILFGLFRFLEAPLSPVTWESPFREASSA